MYTSGTTGEPKGVILNNEAIMAEVLSLEQMLHLTDKVVSNLVRIIFQKLSDLVAPCPHKVLFLFGLNVAPVWFVV